MNAIIEGHGLTKTYAQGEAAMRALDEVTLDVRRGELMLLVGPSGSGKTTLLSILGCILRPTSGTLRVMGEDVTRMKESDLPAIRRERIGFIFQAFNLFPTLTAAQNVALALDLKGISGRLARTRAASLLEQVGLGAKLDAYPADLSGGQKQRVAIARALAGDPPVILADEPTAALDSHSGRAVMDLLKTLARERGRAIAIVTHDNRMLGYADRTVHMEGGRLQRVLVDEGDAVKAGQILAVIGNDDYRARVASAEATLRLREADGRRIHNGARDQERRDAAAAVREADAVVANVTADVERRRGLFKEAVISQAELDKAEEQFGIARAKADSARERLSLIDAGSREEDLARADAEVALAQAALDEARAVLEKTYVRAPIDGVVFRRHRKVGESVSTQFDSPIVTLADRSRVRVRVDVDETDVAKLGAGQLAYVTANAFGDRRFPGRIVRVGRMLGRKNVRTDEPAERVDTKVLETLVELADGHELPLGLRVQAFIMSK